LLFDLDGVLVDSTAAVARVWRRWAFDHGLDPEVVVDHAHRRRSLETIQIVAPQLDAEAENVRVEELEIAEKAGVIALPGAVALLRRLPRNRFTVVTSATRPLAVARLGYADLPVPPRFISADDVTEGKPAPEPYLKGAVLLGLSPADCIAFEDTHAGIAAAQAAGMLVIGLRTTYSSGELAAADFIVASLADVRVELHEEALLVYPNLQPSDLSRGSRREGFRRRSHMTRPRMHAK
jgi:mannitol-1-/sugar-/sorbitol-6-phosphatase